MDRLDAHPVSPQIPRSDVARSFLFLYGDCLSVSMILLVTPSQAHSLEGVAAMHEPADRRPR